MPKRKDISSILILGAGPIVIGQACEFDYSGTQACKALKEEGYRVILVNSNPATIMTDPGMADATYIEPLDKETVEKIIEIEKPDVLLPTMGGQTALNCALSLERAGVLEKLGIKMIGANAESIDKAEDRSKFANSMKSIGLECPNSGIAHSMEEAFEVLEKVGLPCIIRPSFTMGGTGGGIAYNKEEFEDICSRGLDLSPTRELLIDESLIGWREYEMEVIRDKNDNCIIVCSIQNLDPMGVHTGDSITVAPAQTLTDKEYQIMRNASFSILREIGVETGGSNVQFGICPVSGRMVVIEMNPRVSRSSALASKATGFPIARVAAKLAIGYTLDELKNEITKGETPASFEPSIDYIVTKIPRFAFEKFPHADKRLTTQMKSVGEAMAIGRTFQESLQKAIRSLEIGVCGLDEIIDSKSQKSIAMLKRQLAIPSDKILWYIADAFRMGMSFLDIQSMTMIDPWFLAQIEDLIQTEIKIRQLGLPEIDTKTMYKIKRKGFSDLRLAKLLDTSEESVRNLRYKLGIFPIYKRVDTCAAEFSTSTAYMYSSYEKVCESAPSSEKKIVILGGGPNRIGQGIEFDYCCVHAALALREKGYETIMVNCNPETVSTDYDISDRLYFEPITLEDVLEIIRVENPEGVIVQYGGQTPLKLAGELEKLGVTIIGTSSDAIDRAEDRDRFQRMVSSLKLKQPPNSIVHSINKALTAAFTIGYPLIVRPSYVLGGRSMEIVHEEEELLDYLHNSVTISADNPVLLESFLNCAIEVDVDAISDGNNVVIGAIMQHIEQAGVHSGDSACSLPPYSLPTDIQNQIRNQVRSMALELGVIGLMNVQLGVQGEDIYIIEINPRASRTVPFISKCIGVSLAMVSARVMLGESLKDIGFIEEIIPTFYSVKAAVFPFSKFPNVDPILGPEMKSTGEVMGIGKTFGEAFSKAQLGACELLPTGGTAFISVRDDDKPLSVYVARNLMTLGFKIVSTLGTANFMESAGLEVTRVNKVNEGRPHIVDMIKNEEISLVINTTEGRQSICDSSSIRRSALQYKVYCTTTITAGEAICEALRVSSKDKVYCLQELHKGLKVRV